MAVWIHTKTLRYGVCKHVHWSARCHIPEDSIFH